MTDLHLTNFDVHRDHRGVMTAILNVSGQAMNVFNESVLRDLNELLLAVKHDETVKALVFRSGKENGFLAGADLHLIERLHTAVEAREMCYSGQELLGWLEDLTIPTVAVINGVCLGGGLEFALACKHRLVLGDPRTKLGLPEVELGLLPGWGRYSETAAPRRPHGRTANAADGQKSRRSRSGQDRPRGSSRLTE